MADLNQLVEKAKELGAVASAIKVADIKFSNEFRGLCEQNYCGKYGTNWMCPPAVGAPEDLKAQVLKFTDGVVFQTVHKLEDSFDIEGMTAAEDVHGKTLRDIWEYVKVEMKDRDVLALNVGGCKVCKKCTYSDNLPCRYPDKAVASIESYCIDVNALVTSCGIPYINGVNTVSYVGMFLF